MFDVFLQGPVPSASPSSSLSSLLQDNDLYPTPAGRGLVKDFLRVQSDALRCLSQLAPLLWPPGGLLVAVNSDSEPLL